MTINMAARNVFGRNPLQLREFRPKNASFFQSSPFLRPRASFASFPRAKRNNGPQMKASGLNQFAAARADTGKNNMRQHFRGQLRPNKRAAENTQFHPRPKIPRLQPNATTPYRCTLPYLSKELQYKTALAMLYEYKNGLVVNVSNRQGTSYDPLYTASLELDGKTFRASEHSKRKAQQLLAEVVISQMEHEIEQMLEKRAAMKQSLRDMKENREQASLSDQKLMQIVTPSNAAVDSNYEQFDFTSNDDLFYSEAFNAFDSTTGIPASNAKVMPSGISQSEADYTMLGSGAANADSKGTLSGTEKVKTVSANFVASTSDVRLDAKNVVTEDTGIASGSKILIPTKNDPVHESTVRKTAFATLKFLRPGLKWTVKSRSAEPPSEEEFDVRVYVDGETFTGCSDVKLLARQYACEAALVKLFSLEFERGLDGMPLFKGSFAEIAHLAETQEDDSSLNIDGKNPISLLHELFSNDVVFQFRSLEAFYMGSQHCCTVSVAGLTVEGHDTVKKTAKKRAAFAAVSALKASGTYDRRVASAEARHALLSAQQPVTTYGSEIKSKGGTPLLPTPDVPPVDVHPVTGFSLRSETQNTAGRSYAVRGKTFLGRGRQMIPVQANAEQIALLPRGRGQGRGRGGTVRGNITRTAHIALQPGGRGRGRGRGGTVRGNSTRNNFRPMNSSFRYPGIVGNSTVEVSVPHEVASLMNSVPSSVRHRTPPVGGRGRGHGRGSASSGIERGNDILNVGGGNYDAGNIEAGAFGHCTPPPPPRVQVRPMASRITFVGSRGRAAPTPATGSNITSRLVAMSYGGASDAVSRASDFYPAVNESGYEFSSFGSDFNSDDHYGLQAMHYSTTGPPRHIPTVPRPRLEHFGFNATRVRNPGQGRGLRFNTAVINQSRPVSFSRFPPFGM